MTEHVLVVGPASWNRIVLLDRLPDSAPHTVFAQDSWETVGGTSAGKALGLCSLGREVVVSVQLGDDREGARIRSLLEQVGVRVVATATATTERHVNLMSPYGERLSIYLEHPPERTDGADATGAQVIGELMAASAVVVLDLAAESRRLVPAARAAGRPIWTDLHDYDGASTFHQPFLEAADAVFMSADATSDPRGLLARCLEHGAEFAVCTRGAEGAVALDSAGRWHEVPAVAAEVVDTNGAGDAFFTGVLDARLAGADLAQALAAGAAHGASVLGTRHLHPVLDDLLGP